MNAMDHELVERARAYCIRAHEGQTRRSGAPYSTHPIAVAEILAREGVDDPEILAAACLHDVLEDCPVDRETLAREFGERVARLVEELTNLGPPGRTFEEKHRALAEEARRMSPDAKWIKLADRWHNLSDLAGASPQRRRDMGRVTLDLLQAIEPWPTEALPERIRALAQSLAAEEP